MCAYRQNPLREILPQRKKRQLVFGASFLFFILIFARYGPLAAGEISLCFYYRAVDNF